MLIVITLLVFVATITACLSNRSPFITPMPDYLAGLEHTLYPEEFHPVYIPDIFIVFLQPGVKFQDHIDATGVNVREHLGGVDNFGTAENIEITYHANATLETFLDEVRMDRGVKRVCWVKNISNEESLKRGGWGMMRPPIPFSNRCPHCIEN